MLNWYEGKPRGHNTTSQYLEHDIEAWIKKRFPGDHSTWQQLAKDPDNWTKWRDEYAADWPSRFNDTTALRTSDGHRSIHRTPRQINTKKKGNQNQDQTAALMPSSSVKVDTKVQNQTSKMVSTQQGSQDRKDDQEGHPQPKFVFVPGGRKKLPLLMKPEAQPTTSGNPSTTDDSVTVGCSLSFGEHIRPRHGELLAKSDTRDLVLWAEELVQFCSWCSASLASLRGGYSVDWATGIITLVSVDFSGTLLQ